jgi:hypothetical protein
MPTVRNVLWRRLDAPAFEHCLAHFDADGLRADGLVVGADDDGTPYRLHYTVITNSIGSTTHVMAADLLRPERTLILGSDGHGHWRDKSSAPLPELDGCVDVDISLTPFTNTLPIRRLALEPGASHTIECVYIDAAALKLSRSAQTYACTARSDHTATYVFSSGQFSAELSVDADGLVIAYEGLFTRASS